MEIPRRMSPRRTSSFHQHPSHLPNRDHGHGAQGLVVRAADRMRNDRERAARHAEHARHQFGGADEAGGHHSKGGDPQTFGRHGVMQTARDASKQNPMFLSILADF